MKDSKKNEMWGDLINKSVLIRTHSAGVHYGKLNVISSSKDGYDVRLKDSRRVYSWTGACSLSQLALEGSKSPNDCKISVTIPTIILRAIEVIPMEDTAVENLKDSIWKS